MSLSHLRMSWMLEAVRALRDMPDILVRDHGATLRFSHVGLDSYRTVSGRRFAYAEMYMVFMLDDGRPVPLTASDLEKIVKVMRNLPEGLAGRDAIAANLQRQIVQGAEDIKDWIGIRNAMRPARIQPAPAKMPGTEDVFVAPAPSVGVA